MKVAMITGSYPPQPCGVGDYTRRLVRELLSAGVLVDVITTVCADRRDSPEVRYELGPWTLGNWQRAVTWLAGQSYDLIHVQYPARFYGYRPELAFLTLMLKRTLPALPVVVTLHEFSISHILRKLTMAAITARAEAVVLTDEAEEAAIRKAFWWIRQRTHLVHMAATLPACTITPEERERIRRRAGMRESDAVIAYFGFLHPNKGIERLLKAFAFVRGKRPGSRLMMISLFEPDTNQYHGTLRQLLEHLRIQDAVTATGFLPDEEAARHLAAADIAVLPYEDGVSFRRLTFMTALAQGVPTITTVGNVSLEKLGLADGETLLAVRAGGPAEELGESILRLIDEEPLRVRLSLAGRSWSRQYQWTSVVKETMEIYRKVRGV